jgi:hypothetical protein
MQAPVLIFTGCAEYDENSKTDAETSYDTGEPRKIKHTIQRQPRFLKCFYVIHSLQGHSP